MTRRQLAEYLRLRRAEYMRLRRKPDLGMQRCQSYAVSPKQGANLPVQCDWIEGHAGTHNTIKGHLFWA